MWHEGLEEASRLYFGERNVKGMFAVLEPLHAMMERGPQTLKETSFNQVSLYPNVLKIFFSLVFSGKCIVHWRLTLNKDVKKQENREITHGFLYIVCISGNISFYTIHVMHITCYNSNEDVPKVTIQNEHTVNTV